MRQSYVSLGLLLCSVAWQAQAGVVIQQVERAIEGGQPHVQQVASRSTGVAAGKLFHFVLPDHSARPGGAIPAPPFPRAARTECKPTAAGFATGMSGYSSCFSSCGGGSCRAGSSNPLRSWLSTSVPNCRVSS